MAFNLIQTSSSTTIHSNSFVGFCFTCGVCLLQYAVSNTPSPVAFDKQVTCAHIKFQVAVTSYHIRFSNLHQLGTTTPKANHHFEIWNIHRGTPLACLTQNLLRSASNSSSSGNIPTKCRTSIPHITSTYSQNLPLTTECTKIVT